MLTILTDFSFICPSPKQKAALLKAQVLTLREDYTSRQALGTIKHLVNCTPGCNKITIPATRLSQLLRTRQRTITPVMTTSTASAVQVWARHGICRSYSQVLA